MNANTALLDVCQMSNAVRLTVAAGTPEGQLAENAGSAVARQIMQRYSARSVTVMDLTRFGGRFSYAAFFTECISSNLIGLL